jgi:hypothetical protein
MKENKTDMLLADGDTGFACYCTVACKTDVTLCTSHDSFTALHQLESHVGF